MGYLARTFWVAFMITGCTQTDRESLPQESAVRDSSDIIFTVPGLSGPEAVRYDPDQDVYFVANFGESEEDARDANGFISRVSAADGSVASLRFKGARRRGP